MGLIGDIVPFANPTNITDAVGVFSYGNSVTDGIFIPSILLVIFVVLFISMKNWSTEIAMSSSTFIIMILAVLFRAVDLVPDWVVIITMLAVAGSGIILFFKKGD